ncbi:di-heme oxidoredictase family protein [Parendozoicomonas haliclonae]|uniref:di-heme oxidoreductase family protein n=1 Tax=Parendozoicomonas haliclonae TaxID=1960125 RepID=UPI001F600719|nr:di-heme oxidoredictase family protein [Parendozoicomonas haliclonae]
MASLIAAGLVTTGCDLIFPPKPDPTEHLSGGATTVFDVSRNAYSLPAANLGFAGQLDFKVGNSFFKNPWVESPASTTARDGLGPLMNTNGCQNCHIKDGRGHAPLENDIHAVSMLIRLSRPASSTEEEERIRTHGVLPDPIYGGQLQDFAIPGVKPEGQINVEYKTKIVQLEGGEEVELREPAFSLVNPGYGAFAGDLQISPRVAPPMIGLGLLEAVAEQDILAQADPDDSNDDGISGRANWVKSERAKEPVLGRFGWKAGMPTLEQQNAGAFAGDMGITSTLFRDDCTAPQTECLNAPDGGEHEVTDKILGHVTFYTQHLAVPGRRDVADPQVLKGKQLFIGSQCGSCHTPSYTTQDKAATPQLAGQKIWPYTDMLLHDMGEDLADNRPEFLANGQEWRTPPLWGIGLAQTVSKEATFLHDGRARTLLEAVLWHGGEAQKSRDLVVAMLPSERKALLRFLESL